MKRPTQPYRPTKPQKPEPTFTVIEEGNHYVYADSPCTLADLINKMGENWGKIDPQNIVFSLQSDYDDPSWATIKWPARTVTHDTPNYKSLVNTYKRRMVEYEEKLAKYKINAEAYAHAMEKYEAECKKKRIFHLEKELSKLKKWEETE